MKGAFDYNKEKDIFVELSSTEWRTGHRIRDWYLKLFREGYSFESILEVNELERELMQEIIIQDRTKK